MLCLQPPTAETNTSGERRLLGFCPGLGVGLAQGLGMGAEG